MKKPRLLWVDVVRGLAILSVIVGHNASPLSSFIFAWHMPLFFFLSGFFITSDGGQARNAIVRFTRLIVPYTIFALIGLLVTDIKYLTLGRSVPDVFEGIIGIFFWMDYAHLKHYGFVLWFLPALFWGQQIVSWLLRLKKQYVVFLFIAGIFAVVSTFRVVLPFGLTGGLLSVIWVYLGFIFYSKYRHYIFKNYWLLIFAVMGLFILPVPALDLSTYFVPTPAYNLLYSLVVILLVIILSEWVSKMKYLASWLSVCGQSSLFLLVLHPYTNNVTFLISQRYFDGFWLVKVVLSILIVCVLLWLYNLIVSIRNRRAVDCVFVTHLPSFYKVNLYNRIAEKRNIIVLFVGSESVIRSPDFADLAMNFKHVFLSHTPFENRGKFLSIIRLVRFLAIHPSKKVIVGGWELPEFWLSIFFSNINKNCLVLESSDYDSATSGLKKIIKQIFLARISIVFAAGTGHVRLLQKLQYCGKIIVTKGVGIFYQNTQVKCSESFSGKFLYVGRLSPEKNVDLLIEAFREFPDYSLTVVGTGPLASHCANTSGPNVRFLGHINKNEIHGVYAASDALILPSVKEPWGLVVEEALYFGLPVIISSRVGCGDDIVAHGFNGLVFESGSLEGLKEAIVNLGRDYSALRQGAEGFDLAKKDQAQLDSYLNVI